MALRQIALKLQPDLLNRIDAAAEQGGMDRSAFIRNACVKAIENTAEPSSGVDPALLKDLKLADERSRVIVRDILHRIKRLESSVFPDEAADPFQQ